MRRMCQGQRQVECGKRATYRSIKMQHVLPSRSVCVAYHGMSIPLPLRSLYASQRCENVSETTPVKDSGFQSQVTTSSEVEMSAVCSAEGETLSLGGADRSRKTINRGFQGEKHCTSDASESATPPQPLDPATQPFPWTSVGRGRALKQHMSRIQSSVGRRQTDSTSSTSCSVDPTPSDACTITVSEAAAEPGCKAAGQIGSREAEASTDATNHLATVDQHLDCGLDLNTVCEGAAVPVNKVAEKVNEPACQDAPPPHHVRHGLPTTECQTDETHSPTLPSPTLLLSTLLSPTPSSLAAKPAHDPTTPRSSRRSRISLAIQFRGVPTPPERRPNVSPIEKTTPPPDGDSPVLMASPGGVPGLAAIAAEVNGSGKVDSGGGEMAGDGLRGSASPALTQVSELEDCNLSDSLSLPESENEAVAREPHTPSPIGNNSSPLVDCGMDEKEAGGVVSSEDEEVEGVCEGVRMGRSAADIEKSIALHQRNTHRNRVELKRIQRKNHATEEALSLDLAEQVEEEEEEDWLLYDVSEERASSLEKVLDMQLQLSIYSQAVSENRSALSGVMEQQDSLVEQDRLTHMELKCELETLEAEEQLMLAKKEARLLKAKSCAVLEL